MTPLVALTSVHGSFTAHVLAARLTSEGIDVELRGAVDSAYGLTMGDLARVDLYVPEEQVEDAQLVLMASEIDAAMDAVLEGDAEGERAGRLPARVAVWPWVVAVVLVVIAVAAPVLRYLAE